MRPARVERVPAHARGGMPRVLIADDDRDVRQFLAEILPSSAHSSHESGGEPGSWVLNQ